MGKVWLILFFSNIFLHVSSAAFCEVIPPLEGTNTEGDFEYGFIFVPGAAIAGEFYGNRFKILKIGAIPSL